MLDLPALHAPERPTLVGLRAADGRAAFAAGAQLTLPDEPTHRRGHITSSVYSPALGEWIGLALLARAHAGVGTELIARDPLRAGDTPVRVTAAVHFDVAGERMKS
jgi:sarcosine oxidase subunit alpha